MERVRDMPKFLTNVTDASGYTWAVVIVWDCRIPETIEDNIGGEILCWGGYVNAIGFHYVKEDKE
jgi:G:T-mismatch repair DNA endonuclease (very short patch repair protein)